MKSKRYKGIIWNKIRLIPPRIWVLRGVNHYWGKETISVLSKIGGEPGYVFFGGLLIPFFSISTIHIYMIYIYIYYIYL